MKRVGGLFEEVCSYPNLLRASRSAERGKRYRPDVLEFNLRREDRIVRLARVLREDVWRPGEHRHFEILERVLRLLGRSTRWIWVGVMVLAGLAPFLPRLGPADAPELLAGGFMHPVEFLYGVGTIGAPAPSGSQAVLDAVEGSLGVLWIVGSGVVFLVFAVGWFRLHRERTLWQATRVGGEDVLLSNVLGPAVMGLWRPLIVLPRWVLALPKDDLDVVILHEKEHREARAPALLAAGG